MGKCNKGFQGMCCCNCAQQIKIHRHCTTDKTEKDEGCICSQSYQINGRDTYLCMGFVDEESQRASIMFKHGICEMYQPKEKLTKPKH
jgi:hypothetical protein